MACYVVGHLLSSDARVAYAFHHAHVQVDDNLRTRSEDEIRDIAEKGFMYGARRCSGATINGKPVGGELVGLCYAFLDQKQNVWELGGLCVDEDVDHDIVWILAGLAVTTTIAAGQALESELSVVANVVPSNPKPLELLGGMGFEKRGSLVRDGRQLDHYEFDVRRLYRLHRWFDRLRTRSNAQVRVSVELVLGWTLDDLQSYLPHYESFAPPGTAPAAPPEPPVPRHSRTVPSALGAMGERLVRVLKRLLDW